MSTIGDRIRFLRTSILKKNTQELANEARIGVMTLNYWERDKRSPACSFLSWICNVYHISGDWLLSGIPPVFSIHATDSISYFQLLHCDSSFILQELEYHLTYAKKVFCLSCSNIVNNIFIFPAKKCFAIPNNITVDDVKKIIKASEDIYFENIEAIGQGALSDDEWKRILSGQAKENSDIVKKIEQRLKKLPEKTSLAILNLLESI